MEGKMTAQIRNKVKYKNLDLQVRVRYGTTTLGEQCVDVWLEAKLPHS